MTYILVSIAKSPPNTLRRDAPARSRLALAATVTLSVCMALLCALNPTTAQAQTEEVADTETARALFREGVNHALRDEFAEAATCFSRAYAIHRAPTIAYNWAATLDRLGRLVEASELVREVVRDRSVDDATRQASRDLWADLRHRVGHLRVTLSGETSGVELVLDGVHLAPAIADRPIAVDPGEHRVGAARDGAVVVSGQARFEEGQELEIELVIPPAPLAQDRRAVNLALATADERAVRDESGNHDLEIALGIGAAALAVAGGVTLAIVLMDQGKGDPPIAGMPTVLEWN